MFLFCSLVLQFICCENAGDRIYEFDFFLLLDYLKLYFCKGNILCYFCYLFNGHGNISTANRTILIIRYINNIPLIKNQKYYILL
jgi:hypothetical protein